MISSRAWLAYCGTCRRIREIMLDAPWSNFDLMTSVIVSGIGLYLLAMPGMFQAIGGVYSGMARLGPEWAWACGFLLLGGLSLMTVLWCVRPRFAWRLLARMGVALCLVTFALNNLSHFPPPLSSVTYVLLSAWALWGVVRTTSYDR